MILVNNPGSWTSVYWPLEHAPWHGWTPTDLVFPFFLFIVGTSVHFSLRVSAREALRRSAVLLGLGLLMAAYPFFPLTRIAGLRIPGVLQRIAACYLAAFALKRFTGWKGQAATCVALLGAYWLLMTQVPVPGGGAPNLARGTNLAAYVDRLLLGGHMWSQTRTWDPEGVLSTLPAIATTLLGLLTGAWLRSNRRPAAKAAGLVGAGVVLMVAGLFWDGSFPINKNLWTSSYVLFTGGFASALLGLCFFVADVAGAQAWTAPFVVYGRNAIVAFVASGLLAKTLGLVKIGGVSLQGRLHQALFASWLTPKAASLGYAAASVFFWCLVLLWMDRRGLHLKV